MRTPALLYFPHHLHLLLQLLNTNFHPSSSDPHEDGKLSVCTYVTAVCSYISTVIQAWSFSTGFAPLALKGHLCCKVYQNFFIRHIQHSDVGREPVLLTHSFAHGHWDACTFHLLATVNYVAININMGLPKLSLWILVFNSSVYISRDVTVNSYGSSEFMDYYIIPTGVTCDTA